LFTRLPILRVNLPHASVGDTLAVNKTACSVPRGRTDGTTVKGGK
jgi:hypothetical protein